MINLGNVVAQFAFIRLKEMRKMTAAVPFILVIKLSVAGIFFRLLGMGNYLVPVNELMKDF